MYKKLVILILVVLIILMMLKLNTFHELFTVNEKKCNKNNYYRFVTNLSKYKRKKKYVLIFSAGPTLKDFKKSDLPKEIWENSFVLAVKNAVNYLYDIGVKPDFLVTNFVGAAGRIDSKKIPDSSINIGLNVGGMKNLREKFDYLVELDWHKNSMRLVKDDKKGIEFRNRDNKLYSNWGHIMMELAIPMALFLEPENIITIGWDINNLNKHWDSRKETFLSWSKEETILNEFSCYLHNYLKKHHKIEIFKINKNSGIRIPLFGK